jgi:hypothetical protein
MSGCIVVARTEGGASAMPVESRTEADSLAKEQAEQLGIEVAVFEHVGTWRPKTQPVEFVPARRRTDEEADPIPRVRPEARPRPVSHAEI